jgi:hypothetical protein
VYRDTVGEVHAGEGVAELVLHDHGAGVDQPGVRDHPELFHLDTRRISYALTHSVADPDPVGSETFCRIRSRIRKKSFLARNENETKLL